MDRHLSSPQLITAIGASRVTVRDADIAGAAVWRPGWLGGLPGGYGDLQGSLALALTPDSTIVREGATHACRRASGSHVPHSPSIGAVITHVDPDYCKLGFSSVHGGG